MIDNTKGIIAGICIAIFGIILLKSGEVLGSFMKEPITSILTTTGIFVGSIIFVMGVTFVGYFATHDTPSHTRTE